MGEGEANPKILKSDPDFQMKILTDAPEDSSTNGPQLTFSIKNIPPLPLTAGWARPFFSNSPNFPP
jgi:hypothetical protein